MRLDRTHPVDRINTHAHKLVIPVHRQYTCVNRTLFISTGIHGTGIPVSCNRYSRHDPACQQDDTVCALEVVIFFPHTLLHAQKKILPIASTSSAAQDQHSPSCGTEAALSRGSRVCAAPTFTTQHLEIVLAVIRQKIHRFSARCKPQITQNEC